jgi:putative ABC transport system permease protein
MNSSPPNWARKLIDWITENTDFVDIPGDIREEFEENKRTKGNRAAQFRYVWTVLQCLRPFILRQKFKIPFLKSFMIRNYWLVSKRLILKNKLYAGINIFGLAIGIACSLVLLAYVTNELSFDGFHQNKENIYRLLVTTKSQEGESTTAIMTAGIAPTIKEDFPEVVDYARFSYPTNGFLLSDQNKKVRVNNLVYADPSIFNIFSFNLIKGDASSSLASPYSVLLTPAIAKSVFGDENPIGKSIDLNGEQPLIVTGIVEAAPSSSQIQYSCIVSFSTLDREGNFLGWNGGWNYFSYVQLAPQTDTELLKTKFLPIMGVNINDMLKQYQEEWILGLQPLQKVHLDTLVDGDWPNKGNIEIIYIFGTIAIIILFMASINFINLTISQALSRLKEIGVRKSIGANKNMLVTQFLLESFIYTVLAMFLAIALIAIFYRDINEFMGYQLDIIYLGNFWVVLIVVLIILVVSLASGAYPAFYLSAQSSVNSLKNKVGKGIITKPRKYDLLVVLQFSISITLIASTWIIYNQLQYMQNRGLGYAKENVLILKLNSKQASKNLNTLKTELSNLPEVIQAGASSALPGDGFTSNGYTPDGKELPIMINVVDIDDSYLETMDIAIMSGKSFKKGSKPDKMSYLVNETLVKEMGWDDPIGKFIDRDGRHEVIGVVKDFNFASLRQKIKPLIITNAPWQDKYNYLSVRVSASNLPLAIEKIEKTWQEVNTNDPFEFNFLDQEFSDIYYQEQRQAKLLFIFSSLAILIGGMGLFGLVSYSLKQKTKEIGVRKVLGASAMNLVAMISMKYIASIIIASFMAIPLAYFMMRNWLENFYYQIDIEPIVFILAVLFSLLVALVIINIHSAIAIRRNPTDSLKYE